MRGIDGGGHPAIGAGAAGGDDARVHRSAAERGGMITSWLLQLLVLLALVGLVVYEILAVVVTSARIDETAREVARAARDEYRAAGSLDRASAVATLVAATYDAEVVDVSEDGDGLVIELSKQAPTLLVHRIGAFGDLTTARASSRVVRGP